MATERIFEPGIISSKIDMQGMTAEGGATVTIEINTSKICRNGQQEIKDKENVSYKYYRTMKYRQPVRVTPQLRRVHRHRRGVDVFGRFHHYTPIVHQQAALNKAWNQRP